MIREKNKNRPDHRNKPRKNSNRSLNIIYFIDARKTRSFRISLRRIYALAGMMVLILLGCTFSVVFSARFYQKNDLLTDRLHGALSTIFEYQSRYDEVYEQAYPGIYKDLNGKTGGIARNSKKDPGEASDSRDSLTKEARERVAFVKQTIDFPPESTRSQSNPNWPIVVEDVTFQQDLRDMELNFAIRNSKSPERAEGYIWSVLTLKKPDGSVSHIGSPSGIKIDDHGDLINPGKGANWYSIRYYKAKSFYFHLEEENKGQVIEILIGMKDLQGEQSLIRLPLRSGNTTIPPSAANSGGDKLRNMK